MFLQSPKHTATPGNDDAIRAIRLVTSIIADAVIAGRAKSADMKDEMAETVADEIPASTAANTNSESEESDTEPASEVVQTDE